MPDVAGTDIPPRASCGLYLPGHTVHPIQARKSWQDETPAEPGTLVHADETTVTVRVHDEERRYRNHETHRLAIISSAAGGRVELRERWSLLVVPHANGVFLFSIATDGVEWRPCRQADHGVGSLGPEDLVARLREDGGFLLPARQLDNPGGR